MGAGGGIADLGGLYLPTKFGFHLTILSPSSMPISFNNFTIKMYNQHVGSVHSDGWKSHGLVVIQAPLLSFVLLDGHAMGPILRCAP